MFQSLQTSKFAIAPRQNEGTSLPSPHYARQIVFRKDRSSPIQSMMQQQLSNETDNDSLSRREKKVKNQHLLIEMATSSNIKKLQRLINTFLESGNCINQIQENLSRLEVINLFFKVHQLRTPEMIVFLNALYDSLNSNFSQNSQTNSSYLEVLRCMLLWNYEQYFGNKGYVIRILDIFQELSTMTPDFKQFEEEYQIGMIEAINIIDRLQLRLLFLLSSYEVIRVLKSTVGLVESMENHVFSQLKNNIIPLNQDLECLVIAYIHLSEQLLLASQQQLQKQALEVMGMSMETSLYEVRKKFLNNAQRFAQKYIGPPVSERVNSIFKKFMGESSRSSNGNAELTQQSSSFIFLVDILDMNYMITSQEAFEMDRCCQQLISNQLILTYVDRLLPDFSKKKTKITSIEDYPKVSSTQRQFSQKQLISQKVTTESYSTHSQGLHYKQQNLTESHEFEKIQHTMQFQQKELDDLKQCYNQQIAAKKQEANNNQLVDSLRKKIDLLEGTVTSLKSENNSQKKEKDQKTTEVNELRSQLSELSEKQSKLERLVQQQSQQQQQQQQFQLQQQQQQIQLQQQQQAQAQQQQLLQQQPQSNLLKTSINNYSSQSGYSSKTNTQTTMNIQIPPKIEGLEQKTNHPLNRGQSQMSHSPVDDFIQQLDDTSPHLFRSNQAPILHLLELLDLNTTFSKIYIKHQSANEVDVWNSDYTIQQQFKVEASVQESRDDGKYIQLKAINFTTNQVVSSENVQFDTLKSLIGYVDFQEMLPTNLPNISTTHQFFKFLILPYTAVVQDENSGQFKVQLWPKPYGILNGLTLKVDFLDYNCLIYVHHLECDSFRISICDPISFESVKLDLEMDYSTMDYFFQDARNLKDEYVFNSKSIMIRMTERTEKFGEDDVTEGIQEKHFDRQKVKEEAKVIHDESKVFSTEHLTQRKPIEFLQYIRNIVVSFESHLASLNIAFSSCIMGQQYFRCKSWNTGTRNQIQLVKDNSDEQQLEVHLWNCFETFAPNKTKIKTRGHTSVGYHVIQREFSVTYEKLQNEERLTIFQQLLQQFSLNIFEKACELTDEQFDKNPIVQSKQECGSYRRLVTFDNGKISIVTYSVVGSNRRMCGIKFAVFNVEDTLEQGIFLPVTQNEWDMRIMEKQKIKASVQNVPYSEYLLTQLLKCPIVMHILLKKILNADSRSNQINSNELKKRKTYIERLDNILTWQEVVASI